MIKICCKTPQYLLYNSSPCYIFTISSLKTKKLLLSLFVLYYNPLKLYVYPENGQTESFSKSTREQVKFNQSWQEWRYRGKSLSSRADGFKHVTLTLSAIRLRK